jgi:chaperonin GroES
MAGLELEEPHAFKDYFLKDEVNGIIPIAGRVLIKFPPNEKKEVNGLVQLEKDLGYENTGTVVAVGAGRIGKRGKRVPIECKPGDKVCLTKFAGVQVWFDGAPHLMCFEQDVLGVLV